MLKVGVLGAGHLGKIHLKLLKELKKDYEVIGFYDPDRENAKKVHPVLASTILLSGGFITISMGKVRGFAIYHLLWSTNIFESKYLTNCATNKKCTSWRLNYWDSRLKVGPTLSHTCLRIPTL